MSDKIFMVRTLKAAGIILRGGIVVLLVLLVFTGISSAFEKEDKIKEYEIAVTKGTYKVETRDYEDAINYFKSALKIKPSDKHAALLLGISQSRAGEYLQAKVALLQALRLDPSDWRTNYELGIVFFHLGEFEEAKDYFEEINESDADESSKTAADRYLYLISSGQTVDLSRASGSNEKKPLSLVFLTGLQYDSNVILEPTDPTVKSNKTDWRAVFVLDSRWTFLNTGKLTAEAGYMFYQSAHGSLDDFNVQQHNLMASGRYLHTKNLQAELNYQLNYSIVGGDLYSSVNSIKPVVRLTHSHKLASEIHYAYEFKKHFNSDTFSSNSLKTGTSNSAGITERIRLGDSSAINIAYSYDKDSADADFWKYTGHEASLGFALFVWKWNVFFDASYQDRKYKGAFPGFSEKRHDGMQEYSLIVSWKPLDRVNLSISEIYVVNSSNLGIFDYNRSITGLFLEVSL